CAWCKSSFSVWAKTPRPWAPARRHSIQEASSQVLLQWCAAKKPCCSFAISVRPVSHKDQQHKPGCDAGLHAPDRPEHHLRSQKSACPRRICCEQLFLQSTLENSRCPPFAFQLYSRHPVTLQMSQNGHAPGVRVPGWADYRFSQSRQIRAPTL